MVAPAVLPAVLPAVKAGVLPAVKAAASSKEVQRVALAAAEQALTKKPNSQPAANQTPQPAGGATPQPPTPKPGAGGGAEAQKPQAPSNKPGVGTSPPKSTPTTPQPQLSSQKPGVGSSNRLSALGSAFSSQQQSGSQNLSRPSTAPSPGGQNNVTARPSSAPVLSSPKASMTMSNYKKPVFMGMGGKLPQIEKANIGDASIEKNKNNTTLKL